MEAAALLLLLFLATGCAGAGSSSVESETTNMPNKPYADQFTVSNIFSDDMVVQRGEQLRIWGSADKDQNGKKIAAKFMGMSAEGIVENGEWEITFPDKREAYAQPGNTLEVYTDTCRYAFHNVLVGDVYMVIGQSNVAYSVSDHQAALKKQTENGGAETIDPDAPIRLYYNSLSVPTGLTRGTEEVCPQAAPINNRWKKVTAGNLAKFTAIGYFFAVNYQQLTDGRVPVGIIEIDGNGQPLGAFLPNAVAEACHTDTFDKEKNYYVTTGVNADAGRYMYNHYMYPFERYALAGILWYQGESDFAPAQAERYVEAFTSLIQYMRSTHNVTNREFPVYIVEFPSIYRKPADSAEPNWAFMDLGPIRSILGSIPLELSNAYIAVSSDIWADRTYWNSLHPNCKYEQSVRLARLAAYANNGSLSLEDATGPLVEKLEYQDGGRKAVVTFGNVGSGLTTSDGGKTVKGFAGLSAIHTIQSSAVTAVITGTNTVEIRSDEPMKGIAYNCRAENYYGESVNLCNSAGNPAAAFRIC